MQEYYIWSSLCWNHGLFPFPVLTRTDNQQILHIFIFFYTLLLFALICQSFNWSSCAVHFLAIFFLLEKLSICSVLSVLSIFYIILSCNMSSPELKCLYHCLNVHTLEPLTTMSSLLVFCMLTSETMLSASKTTMESGSLRMCKWRDQQRDLDKWSHQQNQL